MLRRSTISDENDNVSIDLTPMIDCVFILLIFFIVTTVFVEETGIEVNKPDATSTMPLEKNSIIIAITSDGQVIYGGRDIGVSGVAPTVMRLIQTDEMPVIIQADEASNHGLFARVYGEAKQAGAKQIHFSTLR